MSSDLNSPISRFLGKVLLHNDWECWEWTGCVNQSGYPKLRSNNRYYYAHRFSYEFFVGAIPEGLTLDHLCENTICVNPWHLDPVTRSENLRRRWISYNQAIERGQWWTPEPSEERQFSYGSY